MTVSQHIRFPNMFRILIADDSEGLRQGMRNLLAAASSEASPQWIICGESADGEDAVRKTEELRPDVILLDLSIPRLRGMDVVKELRRKKLSTASHTLLPSLT
jgi:DNA-binding NarL/FixJ family response regulator